MTSELLTGRTVLVTGAASGIGRHLVGLFARRGAHVVAGDIDEDKLAVACREDAWPDVSVRRTGLDVRSSNSWEDAFDAAEERFGPVDVLLHAAGVIKPGWVHELSDRDVELHLDVNVKGTMLGTRVASRRMVPRGKGHIVNFGSLASLAPVSGLSLYVGSKFAVRGFSLAAAEDLRPHGVAVTLILPDAVATPMLDSQVRYEEAALTFSGPRPLTVDEVGEAVLRALATRPLEITLPLGRGALARLATVAPGSSRLLAPLLQKAGSKRQAELRRKG